MQDIEAELDSDKNQVHIYIKQRTGKKYITLVTNIKQSQKIIQDLRHSLCCSAQIIDDTISLSGDQRESVKQYLIKKNIASKNNIIIHGF